MQKLAKNFILALTIFPVLSHAAESEDSILSFGAFGTLGVIHSDEDKADFSGTSLYFDGVGYSKSLTADVDSLVGGQVTADFNDRLSAVIQLVSKRNPKGDYDPHVEWANIRYEFTPELSVRVGRSVLSTFMASTYRNVGYATPWVRPPIELYELVPITFRDGISANYSTSLEHIANSLEVTYGGSETELPDGDTLDVDENWGISNTFQIGDLSIHASYQHATPNLDAYDNLINGFRNFGTAGQNIAARYDPNDKILKYVGLGASYDPGLWFLMAEWGRTQTDSILGKKSAAYISGGRRYGRLTPYITLARSRREAYPANSTLDLNTLPVPLAQEAGALNEALLSLQASSAPIQDSISLGLRWEVNHQIAFTAQFDHSNMLKGSQGNLENLQPGFKPGGSLNLISASLSFIFP